MDQASPLTIKFCCPPELEGVLPRPIPAVRGLPDWFKALPQNCFSSISNKELMTVKKCPPFIDAMTYGFIMPLPCDVTMRDGALSWHWDVPTPSVHAHPRSPISFHVPEQVEGTPLHRPDRALVKFNSFWTIELEPGWSLFATHPVNREDLPFRLLTGLVDADRFNDVGILFPAVWTDPGFTGTLVRGTPVAQCFAVPRSVPELVFEPFSPEGAARYDATAEALLGGAGVYRRRFRARRSRSGIKPPAEGSEVEP
jgi:hypothetical protein